MFSVGPASMKHLQMVSRDIRPLDLIDIAAVTDMRPSEAVDRSFRRSHRRAAFHWDGRCVAIGGIEFSNVASAASAWLIGTPQFDEAMRAGGRRHSREVFDLITSDAAYVYNYIPETNATTIRWLRHMGLAPRYRVPNFRGLGVTVLEMGRGERPVGLPVEASHWGIEAP